MREKLEHELLEFHPDTLQRVREACGLGAPGRVDEAVGLLRDWLAQQEHFLRKDFRESLEHGVLELQPGTLQRVREACGLGAPGRVDEAVGLLRDWLAQQEHFHRKDFRPDYLENLLIMAKGSIEKTKTRLDTTCTMRTYAPQLFSVFDAKNQLTQLHDACKVIGMPKLTDDHYRICVYKLCGKFYPNFYQDLYHNFVIVCEYLLLHEYCKGFIIVIDPSEINAMDFVSNLNLIELRNLITLVTKGYGTRMQAIHCVTTSKPIELFVSLTKQVLSAKLGSRIKVHRNAEELHKHVPRRLLPEDLGGEGKSVKALYDLWVPLYSTEEHINYMKEMQKAGTDESRRRTQLNDAMFGLPGTFRSLNVD